MIVSSACTPLLILPLIKYGMPLQCSSISSMLNSCNALMYHGVQVEQCLLLRILYYLKFSSIHSLISLITVMVDMIMRIGVPTRYVHACIPMCCICVSIDNVCL